MMRRESKLVPMDYMLFAIVVVLVVIGLLIVFDASYGKLGDSKWHRFDTMYAAIGFALMLVVSRINLKTMVRFGPPLLVFSIISLIAVFVVGHEAKGATRWIRFGPISFQPSEFAKLGLVFYLSGLIASRRMQIQRLSTKWIGPISAVALTVALIFFEPDMGTAIAAGITVMLILIAGGAFKRHLAALIAIVVLLGIVAVAVEPYRLERYKTWQDPWKYKFNEGYQIIHSLIAMGTGGISGVGLCEGREKLYLPAAHTDFIYSTICEEAGMIGGLAILGLFMLFTYRGLDIAKRSKSTYGNLLAVGLTSVISSQAIINVAVVSSAIPATGVPLPFISYGGSSLVLAMISSGFLLAVSRHVNTEIDERSLYEDSIDRRGYGRSRIYGNYSRASSYGNVRGYSTIIRR